MDPREHQKYPKKSTDARRRKTKTAEEPHEIRTTLDVFFPMRDFFFPSCGCFVFFFSPRFFFPLRGRIGFKSEKNADRRVSQTQTNVGARTVLFVPKHMIGFVTPIWLECVLDLVAAAGVILLLIAAHEVLLLKNCCAPCLTRGQTPVGF